MGFDSNGSEILGTGYKKLCNFQDLERYISSIVETYGQEREREKERKEII